jgi:glycosyltransferase involved in cell wall biosynthesis
MIHDVRQAGLNGRVSFIGTRCNPVDYFAAFDVFLLPSREDPFPLVCLEAAAVSNPIICFDNAGGMPEFVGDDCGAVVPYLDLNAMARATIAILDSPVRRSAMGRRAFEKVRERHDVSVGAKQVYEILTRFLPSSGRAAESADEIESTP